MEYGLKEFKFFPAEAAGGAPVMKAMAGPFPDIKFCPTGGISLDNAMDYLTLPNVLCVGGSWIAKPKDIREKRWVVIENLAKEAAALV
jgi:2-dehydro-3-deoxyphosphogluconate aldolase/(4S)-4-hydroxy-2-oxoglutarate aldolase